ncbi:Versicolorin B synthase 5 [Colletotrichum chlorophyti]|uniref:Versicolorin B synthase 5 n=1 Tax=Colletotrichum chlorophyti TaxID=708187 RepID=A0A1Q8RCN5_9PEZI|nr:Versicolorin B synthase 5 [Colletotrichum chlorophyti]
MCCPRGLLKYTINTAKEVIYSARALHSPQLLMLTGIGLAAHLTKHGIEVIVDRPSVGQNMSDHALLGPTDEVKIDTLSKVLGDPIVIGKAVVDYRLRPSPATSPVPRVGTDAQ